jgi:preprotein translocase subunit Sss1
MQNENEITALLAEIRDIQREHLDEYKRVIKQSLDLQQKAVNRQEQLGKTYRIALIVSAVLILGIVGLIIYLMQFFPTHYR